MITFLLIKVYINGVVFELKVRISIHSVSLLALDSRLCLWKAWGEGTKQERLVLLEKWNLVKVRNRSGKGVHYNWKTSGRFFCIRDKGRWTALSTLLCVLAVPGTLNFIYRKT